MSGKLYGVGVGPGDPKLMTYLAVETIKNCPVIAVPADGKEHAISYKIASGIVKDMDQKECGILDTWRSNGLFHLYLYPAYCKKVWI